MSGEQTGDDVTPVCPYCDSSEWVIPDPLVDQFPGWPDWYCRPCQQSFVVLTLDVPLPFRFIAEDDYETVAHLASVEMLARLRRTGGK